MMKPLRIVDPARRQGVFTGAAMNGAIGPGDRCFVTRDIAVGDSLAFTSGEIVSVEGVNPSPQRPENKYVVFSAALQKRFLLSDADLQVAPESSLSHETPPAMTSSPGDVFAGRAPPGSPGDVFAGQAPAGSQESVFADRLRAPEPVGGFRSSRAFLPAVIGSVIVVIAAVVLSVLIIKGGSAKPPPGVPSGWKVFAGKGARLWLPPEYEVGKTSGDLSRITSKLKQGAVANDQISQVMKSDTSAVAFFAVDTDPSSPAYPSSMALVAQEMPAGMSLADLMDAGVADQPATFSLLNREIVTLGGHQMAQIELEGTIGSSQVARVVYIVSGGDTVFQTIFQCNAQDLGRLLPEFQKIMGSISSS
jgi:hypothetical protein